MSLLPSRPETEPGEDAEPRVIGVESDDADDILAALSSQTARTLLDELHDEPAPPAELAERVDTSVQNTQYHLEKLQNAGAVQIVDTAYSEKGREMDVFAPADRPLVIYAGDEEGKSTLRSALSRLLGAVSVLAGASLVIQSVFGEGGLVPWSGVPSDRGGDGPSGDAGGNGSVNGDDANGSGVGESANGADGPNGGNGAGVDETEVVTETPDGPGTAEVGETPTPDPTPAPDTPETTETATETVVETATPETVETAANLPPGLLFFAGGLFALALVATAFWLRG